MKDKLNIELHVVIVDDELLARERLKKLLKKYWYIRLAGEAEDIFEAERKIQKSNPDLIFLDIQMPGGSGFDLLDRLENPPPRVIFVTAFDQFAIRAFKVNALDYLLKPIDELRLEESLKRAFTIPAAPENTGGPLSITDQVFLNTGRKKLFFPVSNIAAISTDGNYTSIINLKGKRFMVRVSLKDWERRLPGDVFAILDRTLMINKRQVRSWTSQLRHAEILIADIPEAFRLGRAAYQRFKEVVIYPLAHNKI